MTLCAKEGKDCDDSRTRPHPFGLVSLGCGSQAELRFKYSFFRFFVQFE